MPSLKRNIATSTDFWWHNAKSNAVNSQHAFFVVAWMFARKRINNCSMGTVPKLAACKNGVLFTLSLWLTCAPCESNVSITSGELPRYAAQSNAVSAFTCPLTSTCAINIDCTRALNGNTCSSFRGHLSRTNSDNIFFFFAKKRSPFFFFFSLRWGQKKNGDCWILLFCRT